MKFDDIIDENNTNFVLNLYIIRYFIIIIR